ncbi:MULTISPECIES: ScbR family autoregulator-binding transcription factor [Actinomadura]|uniref:ScbR family autoregulator-binding transcription factor n=1 Tax=Actinomadura miaoliensis TaxID=430685 RepID=A0ABP7WMR9_9ACTN
MQERAAQTRRTILTAAAELFEARGYQGTRLQDVVAGRSVSKGALYFHFSSKEELAAAVIREQRDLLPKMAATLRPSHPQAIRLLIEMSQRIVEHLGGNPMTRASTRLACERDQIGPSAPVLFDPWIASIERLFDEAKAQGDMMQEIDSRVVAEFIVSALSGMQRRVRAGETELDLRRFNATMWRLILPGLLRPERRTDVMKYLDTVDAG